MKISAAIPALDLAAPAPVSSTSDDGAAGQGFETAVRAVAEKASDRQGGSAGSPPPPPAPERERVPENRKEPSAPAKAGKSGQDGDKAKEESASADAPASTTSAADLLGRLMAGAGVVPGAQAAKDAQLGKEAQAGQGGKSDAANDGGAKLSVLTDADAAILAAAAAAAEGGTTFDGALDERLVITPLGAGSAEGKTAGAAKDKTGVGLEVLHMETHFEPRVDDVVLVEAAVTGSKKGEVAGDALGGVLSTIRLAAGTGKTTSVERARGDEAVPIRFDEALARLSTGETSSDADGDATERRGAKDHRADAKISEETRFGAARARAEVTIDVETTVVAPGSMTSQIADRIVDAFRPPSGGQERQADTAPGGTHLRMTAGGAALKTLTIQLQPENLGTLEVSMRLVEGRLTLELAASSAETATALAHDRAGLKKLLEHAGFSMDEASITIVARDSTAAMAKSGASQDSGAQNQGSGGSGREGSDASSNGERGSPRDPGSQTRDPAPDRRGRGEGEPRSPAASRSSVFL